MEIVLCIEYVLVRFVVNIIGIGCGMADYADFSLNMLDTLTENYYM